MSAATRDAMAGGEARAIGRDRRFATTLARGLSVLRAFRADDDGLGNAELASRTGLPRSTVSRLTFTLRALGYLEHARGDDRYRPGPVLLSLGNVAAGAIPFVDAAAPLMQRVADDTGTLAVLGVRDGEKLLLVRAWRPRGVASLWLEVGHRVPVRGSSSGHALLAALTDAAFARVLDALGDAALDPAEAMCARREGLAGLDAEGFVVADPKTYFTPNIHAAAVPFHARELAEPVVFTCGATPRDLPLERLRREVGPALRASVDALAAATGQPGARRPRQREEHAR